MVNLQAEGRGGRGRGGGTNDEKREGDLGRNGGRKGEEGGGGK